MELCGGISFGWIVCVVGSGLCGRVSDTKEMGGLLHSRRLSKDVGLWLVQAGWLATSTSTLELLG